MRLETVKLILTVVSGVCWTIVYLEAARLGLRERTFGIPFYALALNFAWELIHSVLGVQRGIDTQTIINLVWVTIDLLVLYTYFRFGKKHFPKPLSSWFMAWSILIITMAFWIEYAFVKELDVFVGGAYAAFIQNLLMSILFIHMLLSRGSDEGQSMVMAVSKWLGTLAPTITFGVLGASAFRGVPSFLILILGTFCCLFDVIYILLLNSKLYAPVSTRKHA